MNKQNISIIILLLSAFVHAQKDLKSDLLFSDQTPLEIKLGYSNKDLDRKTDKTENL